jgi:uncharacterized protein
MIITVLDLEREPIEFDIALEPGIIDYGSDIRQLDPLAVQGRADVVHEHRGPRDTVADIRLRATWSGRFELACARCLDPVEHPLNGNFDLIFRPIGVDARAAEHSISASETEIGYYQEGILVLEDVLREQVLLSLPTRTLCKQDCKGLCPHCGHNLNSESCTCDEIPANPQWNALSELRSRLKP